MTRRISDSLIAMQKGMELVSQPHFFCFFNISNLTFPGSKVHYMARQMTHLLFYL